MAVTFEGPLADRGAWRLENENCSVARAIDVVGTRSTMLVLREALYGTTRFDDFVRRTHSTDAIVAARLKLLTELGVLVKEPYREPGVRTRFEYHLTDRGRDLLPVVFGLMQWGNTHLQPDDGPFRLSDRVTGEPVTITASTPSGKVVDLDDLVITANGDWADQPEGSAEH
ncbi:helix-turn-helix domain-containing protein [Amycolatopsis rhabdoformis]|uniref:Helix-turn-helix domain-containing protein n=1 Tax=Amycolatopsis rhabdoformis TaxID=1448059 RepID=A0ABZ1IHQ6_9PSEU|nr:helix-turn-helix domain-containing protein [Amycolatopsis rhabdoformis]WSE33703.1 helix-turn-helix domain-containing protein [Amycolatopsis rhabdoformis]